MMAGKNLEYCIGIWGFGKDQGSIGRLHFVHGLSDWILIPHGRRMHGKAFCLSELGAEANVDVLHDNGSLSFCFTLRY
jgi:hypothetical protein